ncbi:MAG: ATP-binding protein [Gemmataceae bacterium]
MNPEQNPYTPGAGSPPPELAGRDPLLKQASLLLMRVKAKRPEKSMLLTGLRGVGKTVLLNRILELASEAGYLVVQIEAHEDKGLVETLAPKLRSMLYQLDRMAGAVEKGKRAFRVLRGLVGSLKLKVDDVTFGLDVEPEKGLADSGDLEADLPDLFEILGEAAVSRNSALALFIDEIQYFHQKELSALIMAMHRVQQKQLPIVLIGAGLPILPALAGESKSYAERLFDFPDVGALNEQEAAIALGGPARLAQVEFEPAALQAVYELTKGYPYFIQEWGYAAWNEAINNPITQSIIEVATPKVVAKLDRGFFRVRFDRLTPGERKLLRSMAELGPGPHRTGDVADQLKVKVTSLSPRRKCLIKKGMIYSPAHGELAFTVPLFDEFMKRAMPEFHIDT